MASAYDVFTNNAKTSELFERMSNGISTICGLAIQAGASPNIKTAAALIYALGGKLYTLAIQASLGLVTMGAAGTIPAGTAKGVFLFVDASGAVTASLVAPGSDGSIVCPEHPITKVCFGALKIVNGSAIVFTLGTTALDAASITTTYLHLDAAVPGYAI